MNGLSTMVAFDAKFWPLLILITAAVGYFLGCFNGAVIVSKYILKNDIRNHGSGNAGLTNFHRVFGGGLTFLVILTDMLKAVVAVLIGSFLLGPSQLLLGQYLAGTCCMLGHMFPCMFEFKGGKGILSGGTIALMVDWRLALVAWGLFLLLTILTRWVSLGSVCAGIAFPVATFLIFRDPWSTLLSGVCGGLIVWKHRENIKRILNGTESKLTFRKKKKEDTL